jgi:hypothetical protein
VRLRERIIYLTPAMDQQLMDMAERLKAEPSALVAAILSNVLTMARDQASQEVALSPQLERFGQ